MHLTVQEWSFEWQDKSPIATSSQFQHLSSQFPFPLPGILFPNNFLRISHPRHLQDPLLFNLHQVLAGIPLEPSKWEVAAAKKWKPSVSGIPAFSQPYDWTFFSRFLPSPRIRNASCLITSASQVENLSKLLVSREDPILGYAECRLFEDELADCGHSEWIVKLRVMPKCFLCLSSQRIRIDHVGSASLECRISCDFDCCMQIKTTEMMNGKVIRDETSVFSL